MLGFVLLWFLNGRSYPEKSRVVSRSVAVRPLCVSAHTRSWPNGQLAMLVGPWMDQEPPRWRLVLPCGNEYQQPPLVRWEFFSSHLGGWLARRDWFLNRSLIRAVSSASSSSLFSKALCLWKIALVATDNNCKMNNLRCVEKSPSEAPSICGENFFKLPLQVSLRMPLTIDERSTGTSTNRWSDRGFVSQPLYIHTPCPLPLFTNVLQLIEDIYIYILLSILTSLNFLHLRHGQAYQLIPPFIRLKERVTQKSYIITADKNIRKI